MAGLTFTLSGKVDPSYKASLNQAVSEAQTASLRIQTSLRSQIGVLDKRLAKIDPMYSDFEQVTAKRASLQRTLLMVQNAQFANAAKQRIAIKAAEAEAARVAEAMAAGGMAETAHRAGGLNLVLRETLVIFREIGRGNWARVPGSLSMVVQGIAQMKNISLLMIGAWTAAIAGIFGSVFLYLYRVKQLAADLATQFISTFNPDHLAGYLSKLEILNQLQKDVADSARTIQEAHDSVGDSIQRELDLTRDRIAFERELLEAQKANELAATRNPAEREAVEKKYSQKLLANKKEERDAELKAMVDKSNQLPGEIHKTEAEIKRLTSNGYMTEGVEKQQLDSLKSAADKAKAYREQLDPDEKDTRAHSATKDRAFIERMQALPGLLTKGDNAAKMEAAQGRLNNSAAAERAYNDFVNSGDARTRARARMKELEDKVKKDSDELTKLWGTSGNNGTITDQAVKNLARDKQDLALEKARLARVDAGRPLSGREVTERERVGLGSPTIALLDQTRIIARNTTILANHVNKAPPPTGIGSGGVPFGFGD